MGGHKEGGWEWNLSWRRPLFNNEIPMVVNFLQDIEGKTIHTHRRDEWEWKAYPSARYTAQTTYKWMRETTVEGIQDQAFEELWKLKVPLKYGVFVWRLLRDRLPTKINLHRRQVELMDRSCPFCTSMEEKARHMFFHCSKVIPIWWETLSWVNNFAALSNDPRQHFLHHEYILNEGTRANRWKCWWLAVTWTMWQQRNKMIFSNKSFNNNKVMDEAAFLLWTWLRHMKKDFSMHFNQWTNNLRTEILYQ